MLPHVRRSALLSQILMATALVGCHQDEGAAAPPGASPDGAAPPLADSCPQEVGNDVEGVEQPDMMSAGYAFVCLPKPANGKCSAYAKSCVVSRYHCGLITGGEQVLGDLPSKSSCCWKVKGNCAVGRPFMIAGRAVLAPVATARETWSLDDDALRAALAASAATLDASTRRAVAEVYAQDGVTEHASVASFAAFAMELLALGAPSSFVRAAQQAMGEELTHAERAFLVASVYAGAPRAPGALPIAGALSREPTLADFAARTASEGCIAETVVALQLHAAADAAENVALAGLLRQTAEEETEHALLAWRTVRWALETGGSPVHAAVSAVFLRASSHVGFGPLADDACSLHAHGVLSHRSRHDLAAAAIANVIAPAAAALLAPPDSTEESEKLAATSATGPSGERHFEVAPPSGARCARGG